MTAEQQAYFDKARKAIHTAQANLDLGDAEAAVNRGYYAAFYAATAALCSVDEAPKTHRGVHRRFLIHFVASGVLSTEIGGVLTHAFDVRQRADYEPFASIDETAAANLLADLTRFIVAVEDVL